jgi:hypothetical protein
MTKSTKPAWYRRRIHKPRWRRDWTETRYIRYVRSTTGWPDEVMVMGHGGMA